MDNEFCIFLINFLLLKIAFNIKDNLKIKFSTIIFHISSFIFSIKYFNSIHYILFNSRKKKPYENLIYIGVICLIVCIWNCCRTTDMYFYIIYIMKHDGSIQLQRIGDIYAKLCYPTEKRIFGLMAQNAYCIFPSCFWMCLLVMTKNNNLDYF